MHAIGQRVAQQQALYVHFLVWNHRAAFNTSLAAITETTGGGHGALVFPDVALGLGLPQDPRKPSGRHNEAASNMNMPLGP